MEREEESVEFRKSLVSKLLNMHLEEEKTKISGDSILLLSELLKVFVHGGDVRGAVAVMDIQETPGDCPAASRKVGTRDELIDSQDFGTASRSVVPGGWMEILRISCLPVRLLISQGWCNVIFASFIIPSWDIWIYFCSVVAARKFSFLYKLH
ncbi:centromere protein X isoform X1 [Dendrobates tinctorius]|uniref:centromere protein X isoform X1 n=1 Tax=Dendrobates tinctorius TaxID=92724 RepID=UPI003CC9F30A